MNMSTISSFTFRLVVDEPVAFQSFSGFAACGMFYNLIRSVDVGFAESLHSSKKLAPWSASPFFIEYPPPSRIAYRALPAPSVVNVSFSVMDDKLCSIFREAILKSDLEINLINVKAKVVNIAVNTYKFSEILSGADPLPNRFMINFLTPTVFRHSIFDCCPECPYYIDYTIKIKEGRKIEKPCKYATLCKEVIVPLPIPSLMFRNLARIWSAFSNINLDVQNAVRWAENTIMVAGFPKGIKTVRVYEHPTTNKWIVGFMGAVRFAVREDAYNGRYAKTVAALLKMAEMTNVGVRRTAGLGVIKYITPKKEENKDNTR